MGVLWVSKSWKPRGKNLWNFCSSVGVGLVGKWVLFFVICRPDEGQVPGSHNADLEVGVGGGLRLVGSEGADGGFGQVGNMR